MRDEPNSIMLYRPVGEKELALIREIRIGVDTSKVLFATSIHAICGSDAAYIRWAYNRIYSEESATSTW